MILRRSAEVHDCKSDFSSAITAALQANSIVAKSAKSVFAYGQMFVIQVIRKFRYCWRIWLGLLEEICALADGAQHAATAHTANAIQYDLNLLLRMDTHLLSALLSAF